MPGIYDHPTCLPEDRVRAVSKALAFLGTATEALEDVESRGGGLPLGAADYEGLCILLRACAETLEDVERTRN